MSPSLRALLNGVIDYAGLFPPAKLPLEQAIRNYARYRTEPEAWMLGRFICPAARLAELDPLIGDLFGSGPPLRIAGLGRGGSTSTEFLEGLRADLEAMVGFQGRHAGRVAVDVLELRLPPDVLPARPDALGILCNGVEAALHAAGTRRSGLVFPYYEAPLGPDWRTTLATVIPVIYGGFKLRTGGLDAAAFPSPEQVAGVLKVCLNPRPPHGPGHRRPFKATAGLHHPIRHFDAALQVKMHGFLNLFGAGVLASAVNLTETKLLRIVEDEDPSHFVFTDTEFRWKNLTAPLAAIALARRDWVTSFGSCSFDEPRDDLRALGLISGGPS